MVKTIITGKPNTAAFNKVIARFNTEHVANSFASFVQAWYEQNVLVRQHSDKTWEVVIKNNTILAYFSIVEAAFHCGLVAAS